MLSGITRVCRLIGSRPWMRVTLQALVSLGLLGLLVYLAQRGNVAASFRALDAGTIALACGIQVAACVLNSYRWQLLLRHGQVQERLRSLVAIYFVGQFFSLFLPTSTGGDAVRVYQVARRQGRLAQTLLATLQERLLGLGAAMLIGLAATVYYLPLLPSSLQLWAVVLQVTGTVGITLLIYPALLLAVSRWLSGLLGPGNRLHRLAARPLAARVMQAFQRIAGLPALPLGYLTLVLSLAAGGVLMGIGSYAVLGQALDIEAGFTMFCLVVPLVWIVRMLPVSLNGVGLGEGAFVCLLGLFAVPSDKALTLALAILGLQTAVALAGGVLLAALMLSGRWAVARPSDTTPAAEPVHPVGMRHAA